MTNTNCLEGRRCPNCGNEKELHIDAVATFVVTDDGAEYKGGDLEYEESTCTRCPKCHFTGLLSEFSDRMRPALAVYDPKVDVMKAVLRTFCSSACRSRYKVEYASASFIMTDTLTDLATHAGTLWCTRCSARIPSHD